MREIKYDWKKYVRDYRFKSIFVKNLFLMLLVIMLPIVCVIVIFSFAYTNSRENERKIYSERIMTQMVSDIEQMFEQTREKILMIGTDNDFKLFLYQEPGRENVWYDIRYLENFLKLLISPANYIDDIYVYAPKNQLVFSSGGIRELDHFHDIACIENMDEIRDQYQLKYVDRELSGGIQKRTLSMYYNMKVGGNGAIIVNLDVKKIKKEFQYGAHVSYKIVKDDEILFSTNLSEIGSMVNGDIPMIESREDGMVISRELEKDGLRLIAYIQDPVLENERFGDLRIMFFFVVFMCPLIVFVSFYISIKMTSPIETILSVIETANAHVLMGEEEWREENEIRYIIKSISSTLEKNSNFEQELKQRTILLKKAQAVALQSQINPHFMNNTLEAINRMAVIRLGEKNEVSDMVTDLASIMRMALDRTNVFIRLEEEISFAVLYLQIHEKRYKDRFRVKWSVPGELLNCRVIKMILQPILENALQYGIFPYDDVGEICVEAQRCQETLRISISDSGFGMTQEELEQINQCMKESVVKESKHIGLNNVNQRIKLAYGDDFGIAIFSEPAQGTKVTLSIPFQLDLTTKSEIL